MTDFTVLQRIGLAPLVRMAVRLASRWNRDAVRIRYVWQALHPLDPLPGSGVLPEIDVLIPAHPKDVDVLQYTVAAVSRGSQNPIRRVVLVVPDGEVASMASILGSRCEVLPESDVLRTLMPWIREQVPGDWRGWVLQQAIKLLWVLRNDIPTLVLDADTLLLKPRVWIDRAGRQLLCLSTERHAEYVRHTSRTWVLGASAQESSYVTHHQLMQPKVLQQMFPNGEQSIRKWIEAADFSRPSALSEYHSYGAWLLEHLPGQVAVGSFGNRGRDRDELAAVVAGASPREVIDVLAARYPDHASLSFHSWRAEA